MQFFLIICFFIIGSVFGSFLNMLVYRVRENIPIMGRSFCDNCKKQLSFSDLIPIFSFIIHKQRCSKCKKKININYPIIELIMGLLSVATLFFVVNGNLFVFYSNVVESIIRFVIVYFIVFINIYFAYYDFLYWEVDMLSIKIVFIILYILNFISFVLFEITGNYLVYFEYPLENVLASLIMMLIIFIVFKVTKGGGMGEGDIYLFGLTGLILGLLGSLIAFTVITTLGAVVGIIKCVYLKKMHGVKIQFAPFICVGTLMVFFFKNIIISLLFPFL